MIYKTEEGESVSGDSLFHIAQDLKNGSRFASNQNLSQFMEGFAERYKDYSGNVVRHDTAIAFIQDLIFFGYLTKA